MNSELIAMIRELDPVTGASSEELDGLQAALGTALPDEYLALMRLANGAEGDLGESYSVLWPVHEVAELTRSSGATESAPGLVLFAGNGGGTAYGIDTRGGDPARMSYVEVDLIGLAWEYVRYRSSTLDELLLHLAAT
jgi:hypothetical protein